MTWDGVLYWLMLVVLSVGAGTIGTFLGWLIWLVIRPHEHDWHLSVNTKSEVSDPPIRESGSGQDHLSAGQNGRQTESFQPDEYSALPSYWVPCEQSHPGLTHREWSDSRPAEHQHEWHLSVNKIGELDYPWRCVCGARASKAVGWGDLPKPTQPNIDPGPLYE